MAHDPNELVTIQKVDEPTLRIARHALAQHIHLGWTHVPTVSEKVVAAVAGKKADDDEELGKATDTPPSKLTLKK